MDYKKEMNENKQSFFEFYSERMKDLEKTLLIPEEVSDILQEKRDFGHEKYGEFSFQTNFENAVSSPTAEHLREELIDAMNYALHEIYKTSLFLKDNTNQKEFLKKLLKLYNDSFEVFGK